MAKTKFYLSAFAILFLGVSGFACIGSVHNCTLALDNVKVDVSTTECSEVTTLSSIEMDEFLMDDLTSNLINSNLIARDNTFVDREIGFFSFFVNALKRVAIWGGVRLTRMVLNRILERAETYDYYYDGGYGDSGVVKAANHWDDLNDRSYNGYEPSGHNVRTCPICSIQLNDLQS